jgi:hypothetical protein
MSESSAKGTSSGSRPRHHPFKSRHDPGLAAFAAGSAGGTRGSVPPAVVTGNYIRQSVCDEPGCGRLESDPIHEPAED